MLMPKPLTVNKGDKFEKLTVLHEVEKKNNKRYFKCECECGNKKDIRLGNLTKGKVKSCGCLLKDNGVRNKIHGQWNKAVYGVWRDMKQRCLNPKNQQYKNYGGRNITVCTEWLEAENFIKWAFSNGYQQDLSLDRKDVNGNYEPGNCRWVTMSVQQNNKRTNRIITYKGTTKNIKEWSKITGVNHETIRRRLKDGWDVEEALFSLSQQGRKNHV